jgi:hypothetical protein
VDLFAKARSVCPDVPSLSSPLSIRKLDPRAYAAMPARLALERDDWKEAMALPLTPGVDAYPTRRRDEVSAEF